MLFRSHRGRRKRQFPDARFSVQFTLFFEDTQRGSGGTSPSRGILRYVEPGDASGVGRAIVQARSYGAFCDRLRGRVVFEREPGVERRGSARAVRPRATFCRQVAPVASRSREWFERVEFDPNGPPLKRVAVGDAASVGSCQGRRSAIRHQAVTMGDLSSNRPPRRLLPTSRLKASVSELAFSIVSFAPPGISGQLAGSFVSSRRDRILMVCAIVGVV